MTTGVSTVDKVRDIRVLLGMCLVKMHLELIGNCLDPVDMLGGSNRASC
jgi:hypothetical protein